MVISHLRSLLCTYKGTHENGCFGFLHALVFNPDVESFSLSFLHAFLLTSQHFKVAQPHTFIICGTLMVHNVDSFMPVSTTCSHFFPNICFKPLLNTLPFFIHCLVFFFFFLAISHSMWRLSFPTREGTCVPWLGQCGVLTTGQPGKSQLGIFEPQCLNMFEMLKECFLQIEYFINVKEGQNTHL